MRLFRETSFDFLGKKLPFMMLSALLLAAGVVSLFSKGGPL
jgi:hypothetical protein